MEKRCFKCREIKSLSEFYAHPLMGDGHLGKCKTCTKRDVAERADRLWKNPIWRARERERSRIKQQEYRDRGLAHPTTIESRKRWEAKNKHKRKAETMAKRAQAKGLLKQPENCEDCGVATNRLEKHHEDYSKPLDVMWLCSKCHAKTRRKNDYFDIMP